MTRRAMMLMMLVTIASLPATADAQRNAAARQRLRTTAQAVAVAIASTASIVAADTPQASENVQISRLRGVDVVSTGTSSFAIRIQSAMVGDGEPLYVIDGAPAVDLPNGIDWFKPSEIAEVHVLKTAGELSRYGTRGVNGVIVITTKNAIK